MLTNEDNQELTRVGPATPCGDLLRRYWHPIAVAADLTPDRPKKRVRLLGEDLVLFRSPNGAYGLLGERCSHRGASLYYGFLEDDGIRCPYHGWLYDGAGRCLEQPFEPAQSMLKHAIRHPGYPVQDVRGLLFAYLGPQPAPVFPPWDVMVRDDGTHSIEVHPTLNCNWLQVQETNADPAHNTFLHYKTSYIVGLRSDWQFKPMQLEFELCEWGLIKSRNLSDGSRDEGRAALFPNMLGPSWEYGRVLIYWRTPIDDTHTQTFGVAFHPSVADRANPGAHDPPVNYVSVKDATGEFHMRGNASQDSMAWETQGPIRDRTTERLGSSDKGVIMWRDLLRQQVAKVKRGEDPMGVIRDPECQMISLTRLALLSQPESQISGLVSSHSDRAREVE